MARMVMGVIIASVVLYMFGFVYWGLGPYPTMIWKQPRDAAAAAQALREQFPQNGTYFIPPFTADEKARAQTMAAGPVAFVHMLAVNGRPLFEPSIMIQGFVLNLVVIAMIAVLLHLTALPGYGGRAGLVVLIGLTATLLSEGGDLVWWQMPADWKLYQAGYIAGFWALSGLILAAFVRPAPSIRIGG